MSTDSKDTNETDTPEIDASVRRGLADPVADAEKLRQGNPDIGPKPSKGEGSDAPQKKDEDEDDLEDGATNEPPFATRSQSGSDQELKRASAPVPQGQSRGGGGGGGGGDALFGALAGVINGTSSIVAGSAKVAGKGVLKSGEYAARSAKLAGKGAVVGTKYAGKGAVAGGKLAGKGAAAGTQALGNAWEDRIKRKSQNRLESYIEQVEASEKALSKKIQAHNDKYEPFAQHVRDLEASASFQKKFPNDAERHEHAKARAFDDMPEYATDEAVADFEASKEAISTLSEEHLNTLGQAPDFEKSLQNAPAKTQEQFNDIIERNTDVNNVLENAGKASTLDGQDDPALKERLKEATEKIQEMLRNLIAKFLPKSHASPRQ